MNYSFFANNVFRDTTPFIDLFSAVQHYFCTVQYYFSAVFCILLLMYKCVYIQATKKLSAGNSPDPVSLNTTAEAFLHLQGEKNKTKNTQQYEKFM